MKEDMSEQMRLYRDGSCGWNGIKINEIRQIQETTSSSDQWGSKLGVFHVYLNVVEFNFRLDEAYSRTKCHRKTDNWIYLEYLFKQNVR